jgi:pyruvate formate lyase activating enzyme
MELLGRKWAVEELVKELIKDRSYFEKSGGGVTLSGGEALLQADFVYQVAIGLKDKGIHTALDTCGQCPKESFERILPHIDLVLFDIKGIDPVWHKKFTSSTNGTILENLKYISGFIKENQTGTKLWIRTPIIPDATDDAETIKAISEFISINLNGSVERWELCAFNNLCKDKYLRLGMSWAYEESELIEQHVMEELSVTAGTSGVDPRIVHWSGSTRIISKMEVV